MLPDPFPPSSNGGERPALTPSGGAAGPQITQLREPIVSGGCLDVPVGGAVQAVSVQRIQLETDTGKSLHDVHPAATCIDLNRAGCALMEARPPQTFPSPTNQPPMRERQAHYVRLSLGLHAAYRNIRYSSAVVHPHLTCGRRRGLAFALLT